MVYEHSETVQRHQHSTSESMTDQRTKGLGQVLASDAYASKKIIRLQTRKISGPNLEKLNFYQYQLKGIVHNFLSIVQISYFG